MKYLALLLLIMCLPLSFASAQVVQYGESGLSIDMSPSYPAPGELFSATANDYSLPIQGTTIRWYLDGQFQENSLNERTLRYRAPEVGETLTVRLDISLPTGNTVSVERVIEPVYLDIIIEPQTRTPAFYRGRSLPSINSQINATALVNGNRIVPSGLIYTWRLNNTVLEGGSLQGKNNVSFSMPQGRAATLLLDVRLLNGEPLTQRIIEIPNIVPSLSFYEVSSLYGFKQTAINGSVSLLGDSLTLRAEPYHLDLATYNEPDHLEWKIGGVRSQSNSGNPYEITLAAAGGAGRTAVNFHVRNTVQLLQGSQGSFDIIY